MVVVDNVDAPAVYAPHSSTHDHNRLSDDVEESHLNFKSIRNSTTLRASNTLTVV